MDLQQMSLNSNNILWIILIVVLIIGGIILLVILFNSASQPPSVAPQNVLSDDADAHEDSSDESSDDDYDDDDDDPLNSGPGETPLRFDSSEQQLPTATPVKEDQPLQVIISSDQADNLPQYPDFISLLLQASTQLMNDGILSRIYDSSNKQKESNSTREQDHVKGDPIKNEPNNDEINKSKREANKSRSEAIKSKSEPNKSKNETNKSKGNMNKGKGNRGRTDLHKPKVESPKVKIINETPNVSELELASVEDVSSEPDRKNMNGSSELITSNKFHTSSGISEIKHNSSETDPFSSRSTVLYSDDSMSDPATFSSDFSSQTDMSVSSSIPQRTNRKNIERLNQENKIKSNPRGRK